MDELKTSSKGKNCKRDKRLDVFLKLIAFIYVVVTIIFYISVIKLNLLPGIYVTIFTIAEIFFTLAMLMGLLKVHKTPKLNLICLIVILLLSGVYIFVTNYTLATGNFLNNVFQETAQTEEYYVVVKKNSMYEKIEDIKNQNVYLFQAPEDVQQEIRNKGITIVNTRDNLTDLGNDLMSNKIDVIFISSIQYDILSEEIEKFKDDTKIIYTAKHEIKKEVKDETNSGYTVENGVFNVYISGIDTSGNITNVARSDANMVATINTKTHEVLLTSIPRDYYVTLHSYGAKDKLTHSGIYGVNETVKTIEDLLGIDIEYYVRVNFTTVTKLVDTLGGIDVYSDHDFVASTNKHHYVKGYNHVNGQQALAFSREREAFADGDNQRVKNQQKVIEAIMKKVLNSKTLLTKYTSILNSLEGSFQTNIKQDEISQLVKGQLNDMSSWTIKTNSLVGTGVNNPTYSMGSQLLYTMVPNATSVAEAKQKIKDIMEK